MFRRVFPVALLIPRSLAIPAQQPSTSRINDFATQVKHRGMPQPVRREDFHAILCHVLQTQPAGVSIFQLEQKFKHQFHLKQCTKAIEEAVFLSSGAIVPTWVQRMNGTRTRGYMLKDLRLVEEVSPTLLHFVGSYQDRLITLVEAVELIYQVLQKHHVLLIPQLAELLRNEYDCILIRPQKDLPRLENTPAFHTRDLRLIFDLGGLAFATVEYCKKHCVEDAGYVATHVSKRVKRLRDAAVVILKRATRMKVVDLAAQLRDLLKAELPEMEGLDDARISRLLRSASRFSQVDDTCELVSDDEKQADMLVRDSEEFQKLSSTYSRGSAEIDTIWHIGTEEPVSVIDFERSVESILAANPQGILLDDLMKKLAELYDFETADEEMDTTQVIQPKPLTYMKNKMTNVIFMSVQSETVVVPFARFASVIAPFVLPDRLQTITEIGARMREAPDHELLWVVQPQAAKALDVTNATFLAKHHDIQIVERPARKLLARTAYCRENCVAMQPDITSAAQYLDGAAFRYFFEDIRSIARQEGAPLNLEDLVKTYRTRRRIYVSESGVRSHVSGSMAKMKRIVRATPGLVELEDGLFGIEK